MFKTLLLATAALLSASAIAQTLPFTGVQYTTSALASAEGTTNGTSGASPFSPLPLVSVATAVGLEDFANAAAAGSAGLLTAVSSTDSLAGAASAEARSSFTGSFTASGALNLNISFTTNDTLNLGSGSGVLFVLFTNTVGSTTTTLFNSVFTEPATCCCSTRWPPQHQQSAPVLGEPRGHHGRRPGGRELQPGGLHRRRA